MSLSVLSVLKTDIKNNNLYYIEDDFVDWNSLTPSIEYDEKLGSLAPDIIIDAVIKQNESPDFFKHFKEESNVVVKQENEVYLLCNDVKVEMEDIPSLCGNQNDPIHVCNETCQFEASNNCEDNEETFASDLPSPSPSQGKFETFFSKIRSSSSQGEFEAFSCSLPSSPSSQGEFETFSSKIPISFPSQVVVETFSNNLPSASPSQEGFETFLSSLPGSAPSQRGSETFSSKLSSSSPSQGGFETFSSSLPNSSLSQGESETFSSKLSRSSPSLGGFETFSSSLPNSSTPKGEFDTFSGNQPSSSSPSQGKFAFIKCENDVIKDTSSKMPIDNMEDSSSSTNKLNIKENESDDSAKEYMTRSKSVRYFLRPRKITPPKEKRGKSANIGFVRIHVENSVTLKYIKSEIIDKEVLNPSQEVQVEAENVSSKEKTNSLVPSKEESNSLVPHRKKCGVRCNGRKRKINDRNESKKEERKVDRKLNNELKKEKLTNKICSKHEKKNHVKSKREIHQSYNNKRRLIIVSAEEVRILKDQNSKKKLSCSVCGYASSQQTMLDLHVRRHLADKPFECGICEYASVEKSHLIRHIKTHTGERPHRCPFCIYSSIQKSPLNKHILKRH